VRVLAFQSCGEGSRVFYNSGPIGTPGERGRGGDDGVDL
jgi:hypothetical protein